MALGEIPIVPAGLLATTQLTQFAPWSSLVDHVRDWFHDPDIGALEISLSAVASHYHEGADPAWLFVIGPSGGDKSSIIVNSCLGMENAHLMGDLTPKTFLSGYTGAPNASLLHQIGSGIMVWKDFTTFISKRLEEQSEIASQLREIYDGYWKKDTGKGNPQEWHGKMTVIAAATPALERHWSSLGDLGERFLTVRLARKDGLKQAEAAQKQAGREVFISKHMRELATAVMRATPPITYPPPVLSPAQRYRVSCMAELLAHARGKVPRSAKGDIIGLAEIENSSRASKELNSLVSGHASLFRRAQIDSELDMWVATRVAKNSIPISRYLVLSSIASQAQPMGTVDLLAKSRLPESTLRYIVSDLEALGLVLSESGAAQNTHRLSDETRSLWDQAFPQVQLN